MSKKRKKADNRRRHPRVPLNMLVQVRAKDYDDLLERFAPNISQSGVYIETDKPHAEGATIYFQLTLNDDGALIEAMGKVVRAVGPKEAEAPMKPGMGVEFLSMTDASSAHLTQLVQDRQERLSGEGQPEA